MIDFSEMTEPGMVVQPVGFDLEAAKTALSRYSNEIRAMGNEAKALVIGSNDTLRQAVAITGQAKSLSKSLTAKAKEILEEPESYVKAVKAWVKTFTSPLADIEAELKHKISQYQYQQELDRRKQEQLIAEANKRLQDDLNAQAKASGVEAPTVHPITLPRKQAPVRTEDGTLYSRKSWKGTVNNPDLVERKYCSPDQGKIDDVVKLGIREMAGVDIEEKIIPMFRT